MFGNTGVELITQCSELMSEAPEPMRLTLKYGICFISIYLGAFFVCLLALRLQGTNGPHFSLFFLALIWELKTCLKNPKAEILT